MIDLRRIIMTMAFGLASASLKAQQQAEMADVMRENGKIYVVVAVCLTILAGLILYLVTIDRKISRIEKEKS
jgi:purine-cytosine permease-like protein